MLPSISMVAPYHVKTWHVITFELRFGSTRLYKKNNIKWWKKLTANLSLGGKVCQISGGSSEPKISAVPLRRRRRRGESLPTSILSSLSLSNLTCLNVDADAEPAVNGAPKVAPLYAIASSSSSSSTSATEFGFFWVGRGSAKWVEVFGVFVYTGEWLVWVLFSNLGSGNAGWVDGFWQISLGFLFVTCGFRATFMTLPRNVWS